MLPPKLLKLSALERRKSKKIRMPRKSVFLMSKIVSREKKRMPIVKLSARRRKRLTDYVRALTIRSNKWSLMMLRPNVNRLS